MLCVYVVCCVLLADCCLLLIACCEVCFFCCLLVVGVSLWFMLVLCCVAVRCLLFVSLLSCKFVNVYVLFVV